jgi:hypothetical protein
VAVPAPRGRCHHRARAPAGRRRPRRGLLSRVDADRSGVGQRGGRNSRTAAALRPPPLSPRQHHKKAIPRQATQAERTDESFSFFDSKGVQQWQAQADDVAILVLQPRRGSQPIGAAERARDGRRLPRTPQLLAGPQRRRGSHRASRQRSGALARSARMEERPSGARLTACLGRCLRLLREQPMPVHHGDRNVDQLAVGFAGVVAQHLESGRFVDRVTLH